MMNKKQLGRAFSFVLITVILVIALVGAEIIAPLPGANISRNFLMNCSYINGTDITEPIEANTSFTSFFWNGNGSWVAFSTYIGGLTITSNSVSTTLSPNDTGMSDGVGSLRCSLGNATNKFYVNKTIDLISFDTTYPLLTYGIGLATDYFNSTITSIYVNITNITEINFANITFRLYNSTGIYNSTTRSFANDIVNNTINWAGLADGVYTYNVVLSDYAGNSNTTPTKHYTIDTATPIVTLISPVSEWTSSSNVQFKFNVSDVSIANCSLIIGGTINKTAGGMQVGSTQTITQTLANADYSWKINCTDYTVHTNTSATRSLTVNYAAAEDDSGSSSSSSETESTVISTSFWINSYFPTDVQTATGFAKLLKEKERVRVKVGKETHYVGIIKLTSTHATINVSSDSQQAVFGVGETKFFEVTNDSYYDIKVKLTSVNSTAANVTIWYVRESMPATTAQNITQNITSTTNSSGTGNESATTTTTITGGAIVAFFSKTTKNKWFWPGLALAVAILAGVGTLYFLRKRKRSERY